MVLLIFEIGVIRIL